jgi:hypothetical protein
VLFRSVQIKDKILSAISPKDINAKSHFWEAFGNDETEVSANWIVRYMQEKGKWVPFTEEEIRDFQNKTCKVDYQREFYFNNLLEHESDGRTIKNGKWIKQNENGKLEITADFVYRCYNSSPASTTSPSST